MAGLGIPNLDFMNSCSRRAITKATSTCQPLAVRTKDHGAADSAVRWQSVDHLTVLDIPHLHRLVPGKRGQALAVRAEHHAINKAAVPFQREILLAGPHIPHLNFTWALGSAKRRVGPVSATRHARIVRAESNAGDRCGMPP